MERKRRRQLAERWTQLEEDSVRIHSPRDLVFLVNSHSRTQIFATAPRLFCSITP